MFCITASNELDVSTKLNRLRENWSEGKPNQVLVMTDSGNFIADIGDE